MPECVVKTKGLALTFQSFQRGLYMYMCILLINNSFLLVNARQKSLNSMPDLYIIICFQLICFMDFTVLFRRS